MLKVAKFRLVGKKIDFVGNILALILMYNSSKERSFEDHSNAPLIFVLV